MAVRVVGGSNDVPGKETKRKKSVQNWKGMAHIPYVTVPPGSLENKALAERMLQKKRCEQKKLLKATKGTELDD